MLKVSPFLWFDHQAEDAARLYVSLFPNSKLGGITRYGPGSPGPEGSVMTVQFELDGLPVTALNGGPMFKHSEAFSFSVICEDQAEVDHYWAKLTDGGEEGPCAWLKDRFGLSWQIVPKRLPELMGDPDRGRASRAVAAMMKMKKIVIADLEAAADGAG